MPLPLRIAALAIPLLVTACNDTAGPPTPSPKELSLRAIAFKFVCARSEANSNRQTLPDRSESGGWRASPKLTPNKMRLP